MTELRIDAPNEKAAAVFTRPAPAHRLRRGQRRWEELGGTHEGKAFGAAVRGDQASDRAQDAAGAAEQPYRPAAAGAGGDREI